MPGLAPEVVGSGDAAPQPCSSSWPGLCSQPAGAERPAPSGEAAQEQEKGRTVLLNQVDVKAPEDQPQNSLFKPHIHVRSNAAGGHVSAPAHGLGLQLGAIFSLIVPVIRIVLLQY